MAPLTLKRRLSFQDNEENPGCGEEFLGVSMLAHEAHIPHFSAEMSHPLARNVLKEMLPITGEDTILLAVGLHETWMQSTLLPFGRVPKH